MPDQWLPDIVICTESWLTPDIYDAEIITSSLGYTMFRRDMGSRRGDVSSLYEIYAKQLGYRNGKQTVKYCGLSYNLQGLPPGGGGGVL